MDPLSTQPGGIPSRRNSPCPSPAHAHATTTSAATAPSITPSTAASVAAAAIAAASPTPENDPWPDIERNFYNQLRETRAEEDRALEAYYVQHAEPLRHRLVENYRRQGELLQKLNALRAEYDAVTAELDGLDRHVAELKEAKRRERLAEDEEKQAWFAMYRRGGLAYRGSAPPQETGKQVVGNGVPDVQNNGHNGGVLGSNGPVGGDNTSITRTNGFESQARAATHTAAFASRPNGLTTAWRTPSQHETLAGASTGRTADVTEREGHSTERIANVAESRRPSADRTAGVAENGHGAGQAHGDAMDGVEATENQAQQQEPNKTSTTKDSHSGIGEGRDLDAPMPDAPTTEPKEENPSTPAAMEAVPRVAPGSPAEDAPETVTNAPTPSTSTELSEAPAVETPRSRREKSASHAAAEDPTVLEVRDSSGELIGRVDLAGIDNALVDKLRALPFKRVVQIRHGRRFTPEELKAVPRPEDRESRAPRLLGLYIQATGEVQGKPCVDCAQNFGPFHGCVVVPGDEDFPKCGNCEWSKKKCQGAALESPPASTRRRLPNASPSKALAAGPATQATNANTAGTNNAPPVKTEVAAEEGPTKKGPRKSLPNTRRVPLPSTPAASQQAATHDPDLLPEITKANLCLKDNGVVFTDPPVMRGVPLEKISPSHPYWDPEWKPIEEIVEPLRQKHQERFEQLEKSGSTHRDKHLANRDAKRGRTILKFLKDGELHPYQLIGKAYINHRITNYDTLFRLAQLLSEELPKFKLDVTPSQWLRHRICELFEENDKFDVAGWLARAYHDRKVEQLREKHGFPRVGRPPAHAVKQSDNMPGSAGSAGGGSNRKSAGPKSLKRKDPHQTPDATPSKPGITVKSSDATTGAAAESSIEAAAGSQSQQRPTKIRLVNTKNASGTMSAASPTTTATGGSANASPASSIVRRSSTSSDGSDSSGKQRKTVVLKVPKAAAKNKATTATPKAKDAVNEDEAGDDDDNDSALTDVDSDADMDADVEAEADGEEEEDNTNTNTNSPLSASIEAAIDHDGYTSTDSCSGDRLYHNDWRVFQVKTRSFATHPGVTQYWHFVTGAEVSAATTAATTGVASGAGNVIEHQVLESVKPIKWSVFKRPYNFHLRVADIASVTFAQGSPKIAVQHKKERDGKDVAPRGDILAEFKRERTKRRFLTFMGKERGVRLVEVSKDKMEEIWKSINPERLPGPDSD
ncbi:hypothetical protein VTJ04DRAFT_88 [Mycothermus thermophilus]|uniref:uncharacterized protein n=1 Tax=Humicola insolens TaxID=85995 RepID=UPI003743461C